MKGLLCSIPECSTKCNSCTNNHNPLLTGLDIEARHKIDSNKSKIIFKKGEYIFKEGLFPSGLFCLNQGKVMVTKSDDFGNSIIINLHKEVTFLGIADYIAQIPYQSNCIALDDTKVCILRNEDVQGFISNNRTFSNRLLSTLSSQFHRSNKRLLIATKKQMSSRLADALLELDEVFGTNSSGYLDVYLKRSDLALLGNMSEANAIRHLSSFGKNGIIRIHRKQIEILDKKRLQRESELV